MTVVATKTPAEIKDFTLNWALDLGADTISSSTWSVSPTGPAITQSTNTTTQTTVWLSGGTAASFYDVTNVITTAAGRTLTKTFTLNVLQNNYL